MLACAPRPFTHFSGARVNEGRNLIFSCEGYNPALYLYPIKDNYFRTKTISFGYGVGEVYKPYLLRKLLGGGKITQEIGLYSTLLYPHPITNMPFSDTWESQNPVASLLLDIFNYSFYVKFNIKGQGQFLSLYMSYTPIFDVQSSLFLGIGEPPFSVYFGGTYWSQIFIWVLNNGGSGLTLTAGLESRFPNKKIKLGIEGNFVKRFYDPQDEGRIERSFFNFGINLGYRIK